MCDAKNGRLCLRLSWIDRFGQGQAHNAHVGEPCQKCTKAFGVAPGDTVVEADLTKGKIVRHAVRAFRALFCACRRVIELLLAVNARMPSNKYVGMGGCLVSTELTPLCRMLIQIPRAPCSFVSPMRLRCPQACFCCKNCDEQLAEYNYYEYEDDIYCGRCHAEMFMPRCAGCDELIFDPTYTVAEDKKWHLVHFCCWVCDVDLCEKQYAKDPESNPVCLPCYNDKYAIVCATCTKPITAGDKAMRAGELSYHHTADCFQCKVCKSGLENKKCVQLQDGTYCSDCFHKV